MIPSPLLVFLALLFKKYIFYVVFIFLRQSSEQEKAECVAELRSAQNMRIESEKRRKQVETQLIELTSRLAESEKCKLESGETVNKMQVSVFSLERGKSISRG
jgi:hypothetical protein